MDTMARTANMAHCAHAASPGVSAVTQSDHDGRAAYEDEVELRVYKSKLRPEKYCAGDDPTPPTHLNVPPSRRPRHGLYYIPLPAIAGS